MKRGTMSWLGLGRGIENSSQVLDSLEGWRDKLNRRPRGWPECIMGVEGCRDSWLSAQIHSPLALLKEPYSV